MKYDVFISYRRDGGDTLSQLIYDRLTHRGYRVFLDIESLNAGKFNEKLLEVIEECKDMIIVLPPKGMDRCQNKGDWVFRELEHGIKHKKNIVPVLMKGFEWPDNIPEEIADIQNYNGIIDNKDYFDAVIDKLTTLLISKPVVGGKVFRKLGERSSTIKSQIKKRKRILFAAVTLVVAAVAAFGVFKYMEKQRRIVERSNVIIQLTPSEEMSATEYYDAVESVKERFDILADGQKYSFEDEKDEITITIPGEVFHDIDVEQTLKCYLTRPTEIYLTKNLEIDWLDSNSGELKESDYFHIDRSEIEKVELVKEAPVEVDFDGYKLHGIESEEECRFIAVTVSDQTVKAAKEWMQTVDGKEWYLYQDLEEMGIANSYYYKMAGLFETDNTFYFVDNFQYSNYLDLILHNYQNDTFSKSFYFLVKLPVSWEYDDDENITFGKNQCNIDELDETRQVRLDYKGYIDELTEGEHKDILNMFKAKMDSLGVPYALGYIGEGIEKISVATDAAYVNTFVRENIGETNQMSVHSKFHEIMSSYYIDSVEVEEKADGTYQLVLVPGEYWKKVEKENGVDQIDANEEIYLSISGSPKMPLDASTLTEAFDGERFVFDSLSLYEKESINADEKFMFDFLKAIQETDISQSYYLEDVYTELQEDEYETIIPDSIASEERTAFFEEKISEIENVGEYKVSVTENGQMVKITVTCPDGVNYAEYVNNMIQKIYENGNLASGDPAYIDFTFNKDSKSHESICVVLNNSMTRHSVEFRASYAFLKQDEDVNEFERIFNEDAFYKQLSVQDFYIKDGKLSFK